MKGRHIEWQPFDFTETPSSKTMKAALRKQCDGMSLARWIRASQHRFAALQRTAMSVSKRVVAPAIAPPFAPAPRPAAARSPFMLFSEACEVTTFTRQFLYSMIERGEFCSPVKLGIRRKAFVRTEVEEWVADRISASRRNG